MQNQTLQNMNEFSLRWQVIILVVVKPENEQKAE